LILRIYVFSVTLLEEDLIKCRNMFERKWISVIFTIFLHFIDLLWFIYLMCTVNCAILNNSEKYTNKCIVPRLCCALSLCVVNLMYVNWLCSICNPHGNSVTTVLFIFLCCLGQNCKYIWQIPPKGTVFLVWITDCSGVHNWNNCDLLHR